MTAITKIIARVVTADLEYADTQSRVHLGIAGREFRLATGDERDFARGSEREFVLGEDANVLNPEHNDPRLSPVLDTADLDHHPVHLRPFSMLRMSHETSGLQLAPAQVQAPMQSPACRLAEVLRH
jgi:hypothetical protein